MLYLIALLFSAMVFAQTILVVERERGSVALIDSGGEVHHIGGLGNMNHATIKFFFGHAYVISRDGYISKVSLSQKKLLKKAKVGDSSIGFISCGGKIAVANYSPTTVVFLSPELETLKVFETRSRNVGIKSDGQLLFFSLMDKDKLWVIDCRSLKVVRTFKNVGAMPFDALFSGDRYIVGFFKESSIGVLDTENLVYRKVKFQKGSEEVTFKIPHFGLWGVYGELAYIPAVAQRKIHVVNIKTFRYIGSVELPGLPVFVAVSPDGKYIGVNFSGDKEDFFSLFDRNTLKELKRERLGRRIMHFRFSPDSGYIYLSSYYENKLKKVSVPELDVVREITLPTPSGVFIGGGSHGKGVSGRGGSGRP